jgi:hypothetical protein
LEAKPPPKVRKRRPYTPAEKAELANIAAMFDKNRDKNKPFPDGVRPCRPARQFFALWR